MPVNLVRTLLTTSALMLGLATVAAEAGPAQSYQYERPAARHLCRPPLKFAAGACVRRCPAGYRDNGRYCRLLSQRF